MAEEEAHLHTLDGAQEAFEADRTRESASRLLTVATRYWNDDMIGDESYSDQVRLVRDWLNEPDPLHGLLKEAGKILDEIDDLPMTDDGSRELPAGSLDRAREIAAIAARLIENMPKSPR